MSTSRAYLHHCTLTLVLVVFSAVFGGGWQLGVSTAVAGGFVLFNLAVSGWLASRWVQAPITQADPAAGAHLLLKHLLVLAAAVLLVNELGPLPVALALAVVPAGALLHVAVHLLQRADAAAVSPASTLRESSC
jgi:hypothetical protein